MESWLEKKHEIHKKLFYGSRGPILKLSLTLDRGIQNIERSSEVNARNSPSQSENKSFFHGNGLLLKSQRDVFWKSVQRRFQKKMFFNGRRHFLKNVVWRCPCYMGQKQINRWAINCKSGIMCFTTVRMTFWSVKRLEPHDLRRMETN